MKIQVTDFRNIKQLDIEIAEEKANFIYGISGTGKSSLIKAISAIPGEKDTPVSSPDRSPVILIDGQSPNYGAVRVYDDNTVSGLILQPVENETAYDALVGDEAKVEKLRARIDDALKELNKLLPEMIVRRGKIDNLIKAFGAKAGKASSGLSKIQKEVDSKPAGATRTALQNGSKYLAFINAGTALPQYESGKCPFCNRKMSETAISRIRGLKSLTQSTLKLISDNSQLLSDLSIKEPDWMKKRALTSFEKEIERQMVIRGALDSIIKLCALDESNLDKTLVPNLKTLAKNLHGTFPEAVPILEKLNENSTELKKLLGQMQTEFKNLVRKKREAINASIREMGIPYEIRAEALDRSSKTITYRIKHIEDKSEANRGELLSEGEKNIIALLLFLEKDDGEILLFDDPVSSYDGYRRSQLYKRIVAKQNKTIIVCSHDQSFIKQAVIDKMKGGATRNKVGETVMLAHAGNQMVAQNIEEANFGSLRAFVLGHIQNTDSLSQFRTILNIRLLCELDGYRRLGDKKQTAWGYTSKILHREDRGAIIKYLEKRGYTETEILKLIESEFGIAVTPIAEKYVDDNCDGYTLFEKVLFCRELKGISKSMKSVLDDIVHLNNSLVICLDPYHYNDYPTYIVDTIENISKACTAQKNEQATK
ncbi:MAG: AAA family ATPase [Eggerthellaceae bacterium]|nr:AAA family ATPase [Eggerthellaceae bacterium]